MPCRWPSINSSRVLQWKRVIGQIVKTHFQVQIFFIISLIKQYAQNFIAQQQQKHQQQHRSAKYNIYLCQSGINKTSHRTTPDISANEVRITCRPLILQELLKVLGTRIYIKSVSLRYKNITLSISTIVQLETSHYNTCMSLSIGRIKNLTLQNNTICTDGNLSPTICFVTV